MKMTRRILSLVLALAMVITCGITGLVLPASAEGEAEEPVNLIVNGDFELGSTADWGNSSYIVEGKGKGGGYGYYFNRTQEESDAVGGDWYGAGAMRYASPLLALLEADTTYIFSFDYKTSGDVHGQFYRQSVWGVLDNGTAFKVEGSGLGTSVGEWTTKTFVFKTDETTAPNTGWELMVRTYRLTGEVWYDNFSLVKAPASIALDKTEEYLTFEGTTTLTAEGINCDLGAVEWSSSDETVATVKDGVVTAKSKQGKTVITAKSGTVTVSCVVSVFQYKNLMPNWDFSAENSGYTFYATYTAEDETKFASGTEVAVETEEDGNRYIVLPKHLSTGITPSTTADNVACKWSYATTMSPRFTSMAFNETIVKGDYYMIRMQVKNPSGKKVQIQLRDGIKAWMNCSVAATQTDWVELQWIAKADCSGTSFAIYYDTTIDNGSDADKDTIREYSEGYSERTQTGGYLYIDDLQVYHLPKYMDNTFNFMPAGDCEDAIPSSLMGLGSNWERRVEKNGNHYLANNTTSTITTWVKWAQNNTEAPLATTTVGEETKNVYYKMSYRFKDGRAYYDLTNTDYFDTALVVGDTSTASSEWKTVTVYLILGKDRTPNIKYGPNAAYFSYFRMEKNACVDDLTMYPVLDAEELKMLDAVVTAGGGTTTLAEATTVPENAYPGNITYSAEIPTHTVVDSYTTDSLYTFKFDAATRKVTGGQGFKGGNTMTVTATSDIGATGTATVTLEYPKSIMTNGDFEDSTLGTFKGGTAATYETVKGIDGTDTRAWKNTGVLMYYKHSLTFKPGAIYRVRIDAKGTGKVYFRMQTVNDMADPGTEFAVGGSEEWKTYEYFLSSLGDEPYTHASDKTSRPNQGWSMHFTNVNNSAPTEENPLYIDNIRIEEVATAEHTTTTELVEGEEVEVITGTIVPGEGYTMVPGTVYATDRRTDGNTWNSSVKMLNKDLTGTQGFGEGSGQVFQAKKPNYAELTAYKVTGVTAKFTEADYAMETIAASVHKATDENGNVIEGEYDGIRFLTRLNLKDGFKADAEGAITVEVGDKTYKIAEIGSLLKRKGNETELNLANAKANEDTVGQNRMWISRAYTEGSNYLLVDYTESYIDFAVIMMTAAAERKYTSRGYMLLVNVEDETDTIEVLSTASFSDSINSAVERL